MTARLKFLILLGSLIGTAALTFVLEYLHIPFGTVIALSFYAISALEWMRDTNSYRRQEMVYYSDRGWIHFLIGLAGPFLLLWLWLTNR